MTMLLKAMGLMLVVVHATETCEDGILNQDEAGVDCGGSCPNLCPVNCAGTWSTCDSTLGACTEAYDITVEAQHGGTECEAAQDETRWCSDDSVCVLDCDETWICDAATCMEILAITRAEQNGGAPCSGTDGEQRPCSDDSTCDVDCAGLWGACDTTLNVCEETYDITEDKRNGGDACPAAQDDTRHCDDDAACVLDCNAAWSVCDAATCEQTYSITRADQNGGTACEAADSDTKPCDDQLQCDQDCSGVWGGCVIYTCLEEFTVLVQQQLAGSHCEASHEETRVCPDTSTCLKHGDCMMHDSVAVTQWTDIDPGTNPVSACQTHCTTNEPTADYFGMGCPGQSNLMKCGCAFQADIDGGSVRPMYECLGECDASAAEECANRSMGNRVDATCPGLDLGSGIISQFTEYALGAAHRTTYFSLSDPSQHNPSVDCIGTWSGCEITTCLDTFSISQEKYENGEECEATDGFQRMCLDTSICDLACQGTWSMCDAAACVHTYTVTSPKQNNGADCEALDQATKECTFANDCDRDCVGVWGTCNPATCVDMYTVITEKNLAGECEAGHGDTRTCINSHLCDQDCVGEWLPCNNLTCTETYDITAEKENSGADCPFAQDQERACVDESNCANTRPPTHPTPFPIITPAPKSNCDYGADDKGPFALDCLQAYFITTGCRSQGLAYPTESNMLPATNSESGNIEHNKGIYNKDNTWSQVQAAMDQIFADNGNDQASTENCRGIVTGTPSQPPTPDPSTAYPTPKPSFNPTGTVDTPAPIFAEDVPFTFLFNNPGDVGDSDNTSEQYTGQLIYDECVQLGYHRQYDTTEYVLMMKTGPNFELTDYYTTSDEICDLLKNPSAVTFSWSDREDGPFQEVTIDHHGDFGIGDPNLTEGATITGPTGRILPQWISPTTPGGRATNSDIDLTIAMDYPYKLFIASRRMYSPCREHIPPQDTKSIGFEETTFSARCTRQGRNGQQFNGAATICDRGVDSEPYADRQQLLHLKYLIANNQFGTCDSHCAWDLDHVDVALEGNNGEEYFTFMDDTDMLCWVKNTDWPTGTYNPCNVHTTRAAFNYGIDYAHAQLEKAMLCEARCDYVNGWLLSGDTCYLLSDPSLYMDVAGATNIEQGLGNCQNRLKQHNFKSMTPVQAAVRSSDENEMLGELCGNFKCYFGGISGINTGSATWANGEQVTYTNFVGSDQLAYANGGNGEYLAMELETKEWIFMGPDEGLSVMCSVAARSDDEASGRNMAVQCRNTINADDVQTDATTDDYKILSELNSDNQKDDTRSYPNLIVSESGFKEADKPGQLVLEIDVPKTMYDVFISFENSTNDIADYGWQWENYPASLKTIHETYWTKSTDTDSSSVLECNKMIRYTGKIPWTVFNLGGAGGVVRLDTYEDGTVTPIENRVVDTEEAQPHDIRKEPELFYQFGSVVRIEAKQPIQAVIESNDDRKEIESRLKRTADFDRVVIVRMPFILRFQKTITVSLDVNVISTKFNYKTVAAIIQSVQHSTQYFDPPYAKIDVQIRTKSQYPYRFQHSHNDNRAHTPGAVVGSQQEDQVSCTEQGLCVVKMYNGDIVDEGEELSNRMVDLHLDWLVDDANCTFTNPDHMREGDICIQEWMLHIEPKNGVCYATGEYSIRFTATCFHGKDVCYLPKDDAGEDIEHVTFTFKIQTSKFCPEVADEVDLSGTLTVTGRNSFKPGSNIQGDTDGSLYQQGETIFLLAEATSEKATVSATEIIMIELVQNLDLLIQTGYNRVPFDESLDDITVWTYPVDGQTRVADGFLNIHDGDDVVNRVQLIKDTEVFKSDTVPLSDGTDTGTHTFTTQEAGFKILLHARAFPVNVDSFADKTLVATLAVTYDDLDVIPSGGRRRRRLLSATTDTRSRADFQLQSFRPKSLPTGLGKTASFAIDMTLDSNINRANVNLFVHSLKEAVRTSLNAADQFKVYDQQVVVDKVLSNGVEIWRRTNQGKWKRRLDVTGIQRIVVEMTFAASTMPNAMDLPRMFKVFGDQIKLPASVLMTQPVFFSAVVHDVRTIKTSSYTVTKPTGTLAKLESSAFWIAPSLLFVFLTGML